MISNQVKGPDYCRGLNYVAILGGDIIDRYDWNRDLRRDLPLAREIQDRNSIHEQTRGIHCSWRLRPSAVGIELRTRAREVARS